VQRRTRIAMHSNGPKAHVIQRQGGSL
jgi:hypothetical protein